MKNDKIEMKASKVNTGLKVIKKMRKCPEN
jgi:hypothetical protein